MLRTKELHFNLKLNEISDFSDYHCLCLFFEFIIFRIILSMITIPNFSLVYKASYFIMAIPTFFVVVSAVLSSHAMGGTLGDGLKKVALGTIIDSILVATFILWEKGIKELVDEKLINYFFLGSAIFASILLIMGYYQVYKITRKLKLSSP